jgi:regulator of protease activity HflC (stomatin/prohibitin superfamily)
MIRRIVITSHERGILVRNRNIHQVLKQGVYWIADPRCRVEIVDTRNGELEHGLLDTFLVEMPIQAAALFNVIELSQNQVGLVYERDNIVRILSSRKRYVFWANACDFRVDVIDTDDYRIDSAITRTFIRNATIKDLAKVVLATEIESRHVGLLWIDGELVETLKPGLHGFWRRNRSVKVELVDCRLQTIDVAGQEILSRDRVSLRINLSATYRVIDAVKARLELNNFQDYLYRQLQYVLREAVGTRTLDELLRDKTAVNAGVYNGLKSQLADYGIAVENVGVKDIILPGDMKDILNQVVATEKAAQANVIRRREETAATRSLLNTAKLMDENPTLMRLKELEALEKVTEKVDRLTVFGGLDGLLQDTVKLQL